MINFLRHTVRNFHHTGAVAPSSPWLAKALAAPLADRGEEPMEVLEAGPGTGALTMAIMPYLRSGDHLTLCEISEEFVTHLRGKFRDDPKFRPWRHQVTIHHGAVEDLGAKQRFHHIISGLPFNNFDPEMVQKILASFDAAVRPGGTINFFEYVGVRTLKASFADEAERRRLRGVGQIIDGVMGKANKTRQLLLLNVPPAWVCSLQL